MIGGRVYPIRTDFRVGVRYEMAASAGTLTEGEFLSLEVRPSNTGAVALYRRLGFEEAGRRRDFYRDPREDGLILTKRLVVC